MNKKRRIDIRRVFTTLLAGTLSQGSVDTAASRLDSLLDEEQDYRDNMPENLDYSQRACDSDEAIDALQDGVDELEEISVDQFETKDALAEHINKIYSTVVSAIY